MKRILIVLLTISMPLIAVAADGIGSREQAAKFATKSLHYFDKGEYLKACLVPVENSPDYSLIAKSFSKSSQFAKFKNIAVFARKEAGQVLSRKLLSVNKQGFPLFGPPTYQVVFFSHTKNGDLIEKISMKYRDSKKPGKSFLDYRYNFDF